MLLVLTLLCDKASTLLQGEKIHKYTTPLPVAEFSDALARGQIYRGNINILRDGLDDLQDPIQLHTSRIIIKSKD